MKFSTRILKHLPKVVFVVFLLSFSLLFYFSSPAKLISFIGVQNSYLLIFLLAFVGGLTTFSGVPYHLVLISLASGGSNPLLLGTATALGVMLGDSTSYLIGSQGREIIPPKIQIWLNKLYTYGSKYPKLMPLFFLAYGSLSPFSNDFIVISAGLVKYPYKKVMIPLALGNLIFNISLAYLAAYGYSLVAG